VVMNLDNLSPPADAPAAPEPPAPPKTRSVTGKSANPK